MHVLEMLSVGLVVGVGVPGVRGRQNRSVFVRDRMVVSLVQARSMAELGRLIRREVILCLRRGVY